MDAVLTDIEWGICLLVILAVGALVANWVQACTIDRLTAEKEQLVEALGLAGRGEWVLAMLKEAERRRVRS